MYTQIIVYYNASPLCPLLDNMWGDYGPSGMLVERKRQSSVPAQDNSRDIYMPYVFNDISTFFTLLVGIYFPSVTGWYSSHIVTIDIVV